MTRRIQELPKSFGPRQEVDGGAGEMVLASCQMSKNDPVEASNQETDLLPFRLLDVVGQLGPDLPIEDPISFDVLLLLAVLRYLQLK